MAMAETNGEYPNNNFKETLNKELLERLNFSQFGEKKFHSDTAIPDIEDQELVDSAIGSTVGLKLTLDDTASVQESGDDIKPIRRRTKSQPGSEPKPSLITAMAARSKRKRPLRSVVYADPLHSDSPTPSIKNNGEDKLTLRLAPPQFFAQDDMSDVTDFSPSKLYTVQSEIRNNAPPRRRSITTMDGMSMRSMETIGPAPTTDLDKFKTFCRYLTVLLSTIYAMFLVTLGLIIFITDPFIDMDYSSIYCIFLTAVGFIYLLYLIIDIRMFFNRKNKIERMKEKFEQQMHKNGPIDYSLPMNNLETEDPGHDYCFDKGRHGGSFYLKLGAAGFALGHLVHAVLLITTQIGLVLEGDTECLSIYRATHDFVYPVHSFLQLFFIFKYCNIIIMKNKVLARFGIMHFIGSSICFWVWTIVRETVDSLTIYAQSKYASNTTTENLAAEVSVKYIRLTLEDLVDRNCLGNPAINKIFENFSPYLYPFTVEYSILIVGVFYIIWHNIGHCTNYDGIDDDATSRVSAETSCRQVTSDKDDYSSNFVIHADCHASNKGIFGGLVVVVISIAVLILGFIFATTGYDQFSIAAFWLSDGATLALNTVMLIAVVVVYNQMRTLDVNEHPISLLDDVLLFICLPAFFMDSIFTAVATVTYVNYVKGVNAFVMTIQAVIQTTFIVDGLRRCSNTRKLRRRKPGRELVMFLLISNVAMWIFKTFSYKSPENIDERYEYYGKVLWTILGHISLPLCMFYRFHSSVCLADIWESAYKPGSDH